MEAGVSGLWEVAESQPWQKRVVVEHRHAAYQKMASPMQVSESAEVVVAGQAILESDRSRFCQIVEQVHLV